MQPNARLGISLALLLLIVLLESLSAGAQKCECNEKGSKQKFCNPVDKSCQCLPGVGGTLCDSCQRGYLGTIPKCDPCPGYFHYWDRKLNATKSNRQHIDTPNEQDRIISLADATPTNNQTDYKKQLSEIKPQLDAVAKLLSETGDVNLRDGENLNNPQERLGRIKTLSLQIGKLLNKTGSDVPAVARKLRRLRHQLLGLGERAKRLEDGVRNLESGSLESDLVKLQDVKKKFDVINKAASENFTGICRDRSESFREADEIKANVAILGEEVSKLNASYSSALAELNSTENLMEECESDLQKRNDDVENCTKKVSKVSIDIATNRNTCLNILEVTNKTLQNSINLANRTGVLNKRLESFLLEKHKDLEDYEVLLDNILAKSLDFKLERIDELREILKNLTETNPFAEAMERMDKNLSLIKSAADSVRLNATSLRETALGLLEDISKRQADVNETLSETIAELEKVDDLLVKLKNDDEELAVGIETVGSRFADIYKALAVIDDANGLKASTLLLENEFLVRKNASDLIVGEYEGIAGDLDDVVGRLRGGKGSKMKNLLARASVIARKLPLGVSGEALKNEIDGLTGRIEAYLKGIEEKAVLYEC